MSLVKNLSLKFLDHLDVPFVLVVQDRLMGIIVCVELLVWCICLFYLISF